MSLELVVTLLLELKPILNPSILSRGFWFKTNNIVYSLVIALKNFRLQREIYINNLEY